MLPQRPPHRGPERVDLQDEGAGLPLPPALREGRRLLRAPVPDRDPPGDQPEGQLLPDRAPHLHTARGRTAGDWQCRLPVLI